MYIDIALKMIVGALVVFLIFRVIGKKAISELTPFDIIYVLLLSGLLEEAVYDEAVTILHQTYAIALWAAIVYFIERVLRKTQYATKAIQGEPAVLISKGKLNLKELEKNHIDLEQLRTLLRQHGCYAIMDANYAILEINGGVTVIKKAEKEVPSVLLIDEGRIEYATLESINRDEKWLRSELEKEGFTSIEDIIYCEWVPGERLYIYQDEETAVTKEKLDG